MQPCIIFIDEIDSFLRERKSHDHEVTAMMKAEFMTLWDGLSTGDVRVLVLGATNRPADIDQAILRRMPKRFEIKLPDMEQRRRVLSLLLQGANLEKGFDLKELVVRTAGYSGSDLKELCRNAAMMPVREAIRKYDGMLDEVDINVSVWNAVWIVSSRQANSPPSLANPNPTVTTGRLFCVQHNVRRRRWDVGRSWGVGLAFKPKVYLYI